MATVTATNIAALLKRLYPSNKEVGEVVYDAKARPFLSKLAKMEGFAGTHYAQPVIYDEVGGRSATFSNAQGNVATSQIAQFLVDVVENHGVYQLSTDAILRGRSDAGAFVRTLKHGTDSLLSRMANDLEGSLFREASGAKGVIGSITSDVITLASASDVANFFVGQELVFADTVASALRDTGTSASVTVVDRDGGTVTISATPSGAVAGDFIFVEGDYTAANDVKKVSGLPTWLDSSAGALFGVTRTGDPTRLAGFHGTGSLADVEGAIIDGSANVSQHGPGVTDTAFVSYATWRRVVKEMGAKVQSSAGGKATGGYNYVEVYGPRGVIEVIPDAFCPDNLIYLLQMNTWKLVSMGPAISIDMLDGNSSLRMSAASAQEVRAYSFAQLSCNGPGCNARVVLS